MDSMDDVLAMVTKERDNYRTQVHALLAELAKVRSQLSAYKELSTLQFGHTMDLSDVVSDSVDEIHISDPDGTVEVAVEVYKG